MSKLRGEKLQATKEKLASELAMREVLINANFDPGAQHTENTLQAQALKIVNALNAAGMKTIGNGNGKCTSLRVGIPNRG